LSAGVRRQKCLPRPLIYNALINNEACRASCVFRFGGHIPLK